MPPFVIDLQCRASLRTAALASLVACAPIAAAQTAPDAGSLLREAQKQLPPLPQLPRPDEPKLLRDSGASVLVKRFDVTGSTRFDAPRLQAVLADLVGQSLGFAQLQAAADRLATLYRQNGLHATALLPEQTLQDGVVRIAVVEGRFGRLRVDNADSTSGRRLPLALMEQMLGNGQTPGQIVDTRALERGALIANELPGLRVSAVLAPGAGAGETDIIAKVDARPFVTGAGSLSNDDARATGIVKLGVAATLGSPAGFGDELNLLANVTEGKQYGRAAYAVPLGSSGLRLAANASTMRYKLTGEFAASGAAGSADTVGAVLSYPVLRGSDSNLYATATLDHKQLKNDSTLGELSNKTDTSLVMGVNGDATDPLGGGGATVGGVQVTAGRIDLARNAADLAADQAGPQRNGAFKKLNATIGRLQRLSASGNLWLSVSGQYASKNLDSGQKFSLGGASGVRAYPSLEASGDNGWLLTVEYRHRINDAVQLSAFYDHGQVTRDRTPQPGGPQPDRYALKGAGFAVDWQVAQRANVRLTVASRIGSNPAAGPNGLDSDGSRHLPQAWLSVNLPF